MAQQIGDHHATAGDAVGGGDHFDDIRIVEVMQEHRGDDVIETRSGEGQIERIGLHEREPIAEAR